MQTLVRDLWIPDKLKLAKPKHESEIGAYIRLITSELPDKAMAAELIDRLSKAITLESKLHGLVTYKSGREEWLGLLGTKVITNNGVGFLVDAWQNIVELENMKYHGLGTGSTAENQTDSALVTELTTEYTGDVRATGSLTEGASANIFRTVATNTLDGTPGAALREHGIFSASTAGVLWDRTVYAAINLSSGESLQTTYDMTASANG